MRQVIVGDQDILVDHLIASSEIKAPAESNYTGFGRDLVPFFDMHEAVHTPVLLQPLEDSKKGSRGRKVPSSKPSGRKSPEKDQRGGSPPSKQRRVQQDSPLKGCVVSSPKRAGVKSLTAQASSTVYCAPGFSQSPKPEALPLPTVGLMQRAIARTVTSCKAASFDHVMPAITAVRVAAV